MKAAIELGCLLTCKNMPTVRIRHKAFQAVATCRGEPRANPLKDQLGNLSQHLRDGLAFTFPGRRSRQQRNMVQITRIELEWGIDQAGPNDMPDTAGIHHFPDLEINCGLLQVLIVFRTEDVFNASIRDPSLKPTPHRG